MLEGAEGGLYESPWPHFITRQSQGILESQLRFAAVMDPVVRAQIKPCWPGVSTAGALGSTVKHLQVWDLQPLAPSQPANLSQKMMCHPQVSTCPFLLPADTDFWQCFPRSQTLCFSVSLPSPQVLVSHLSHKTPSVCRKRQIEVCNREFFFLFYHFFFSRD